MMIMAASPSGEASLLSRMMDAALAKSRAQASAAVTLARCDGVEIRPVADMSPVAVEAWIVRRDPAGTIISVFATAPAGDGRERFIAHGRFTFTSTHDQKELAA